MQHILQMKKFDFRIVETLRREDGSPQITRDRVLSEIMASTQVRKLLVSISNEGGFALAFVIAVSENVQNGTYTLPPYEEY